MRGKCRFKVQVFTLIACAVICIWAGKAHAASCPAPSAPARITVSGHPFGVAATADNCWVYVALSNGSRGGVAVLHNVNGSFQLVHTLATSDAGFGESLSHDERTLFVAAGDNTLALSTAALQRGDADAVLGKLHSGDRAGAVYAAVDIDDRWLFVSDEGASRISVFDMTNARSTKFGDVEPSSRITVGRAPVGLALSKDGRWLYATSESGVSANMAPLCNPEQPRGAMHPQGLLSRIDIQKLATDPRHAVVAAIPAGCNPVRVALSPSGTQLWVTARGSNALLRFNADEWLAQSNHATIKSFPIGTSPVGVAVRPDGKQVWVALSNRFGSNDGGQLTGLADATNDAPSKRYTVQASGFPREVIFLPDSTTLIATLFNASQVVVQPTPN